jgi:phospholipase C
MTLDRRSVLKLLGTSAFAAALKDSIAKALAIPANNQSGTIADVGHIVFMMQENRSFDHYFGTLSGVRGFGDPRAVRLTTGKSVFYQPTGAGGYVLPFHPNAPDLGMQFLEDLLHDWTTTHWAWNQGNYDDPLASRPFGNGDGKNRWWKVASRAPGLCRPPSSPPTAPSVPRGSAGCANTHPLAC